MSKDAKAARERRRREGRVERLERSLSPSEMDKYRRWRGACGKMGVPVTTESRFEFLSDLKEDVTA